MNRSIISFSVYFKIPATVMNECPAMFSKWKIVMGYQWVCFQFKLLFLVILTCDVTSVRFTEKNTACSER